MHPKILDLLQNWLGDRTGFVIVDGKASKPLTLSNSVFQGTVLGPPLWNVFYADCRLAIHSEHFTETVFADDCNCYRFFASSVPDSVVSNAMRSCQAQLHEWGLANQVSFDPSKESFHIFHDRHSSGDYFPLLGVTFDAKLTIKTAIYELASIGHSRVSTLLRLMWFHSIAAMIGFYKAQVLSKIEFATAAIYHASPFFLAALDRVQERFLSIMEVSNETALFELKLAPLQARRDIALLGLIHRVVLGLAPPQFSAFVRPAGRLMFPRSYRAMDLRHTRQLHDPTCGVESRMLQRSFLRLIYTYNVLPQHVVDKVTVRSFQGALQAAVARAAGVGIRRWDVLLHAGVRNLTVCTFQSLFVDHA